MLLIQFIIIVTVGLGLTLATSVLPCWWLWNQYLAPVLTMPTLSFWEMAILVVTLRLALMNLVKVDWQNSPFDKVIHLDRHG